MNLKLCQVDAMLQNLEKEIDDVDAKIGDGWRLLDRFVLALLTLVFNFFKGNARALVKKPNVENKILDVV